VTPKILQWGWWVAFNYWSSRYFWFAHTHTLHLVDCLNLNVKY
jgi:hypothetical protein